MIRLRTLLLGALPLVATTTFGGTAAPDPEQTAPLGRHLAWAWPADQERAYTIALALALPEPLLLEGPDPVAVRLLRLELRLFTRCSAIEESPAGWRVLCLLSDVALVGEPVEADRGRLGPALALAESTLQQGALDLAFRRDGKISSAALVGLETRDRRRQRLHETLEMLLERAFLGLELVTPASWSGGWSTPGPGILSYLPRAQSLGATRLVMRATEPPVTQTADPRLLRFDHEGRGVVQAGTLQARQERNAAGSLSMALASTGSLVFDAEAGALVERRWAVLGRPTASGGLTDVYIQSGLLRQGLPGDPAPDLGPSAERDPAAPTSETWLYWEAARPGLEASLGGERVVFEP